nr:hypothetical protein [Candidatus Sigynarchaeota archaeon]
MPRPQGPVDGYTFICPSCGAYYCVKCVEALKNIENRCWACQKPLDPSLKAIEPATAAPAGQQADNKADDEHKKGKIAKNEGNESNNREK